MSAILVGDPLSPEQRARYDRMLFELDRYPNCRHFAPQCRRDGSTDCKDCRVCPVCEGMLRVEVESESIRPEVIHQTTIACCVNCGTYLVRQTKVVRKKVQDDNDPDLPPICTVIGCKHRTWSRRRIDINGKEYLVCDWHKRQHQGWVRLGADLDRPHLKEDGYGRLERTQKAKSAKR